MASPTEGGFDGDDMAAAIHEAGHVCVAIRLGFTVEAAVRGKGCGWTKTVLSAQMMNDKAAENRLKRAAVSMAGLLVAPTTTSPTDIAHLRELAEKGTNLPEARKLAEKIIGETIKEQSRVTDLFIKTARGKIVEELELLRAYYAA